MDFDDTPDEASFRAAARAWLDANAIPKGDPHDFSAGHFTPGLEPAEYVKKRREWQAQFLNAVQASIGGGTDEVQRNIVAERVLGLPEEPH